MRFFEPQKYKNEKTQNNIKCEEKYKKTLDDDEIFSWKYKKSTKKH